MEVVRIPGRIVSKGVATGPALVSRQRISFLGAVDPKTGVIVDRSHDLYGQSISNRILIFPGGKGSTVGSYVIYQLKLHAKSPLAMVITNRVDTMVAVGAIIAEIPAVESIELNPDRIRNEEVLVNGTEGYIELR